MECQIEKYPHLRHVLLYEYNHGANARQASININAIYGDGFVSERSAQTWFNPNLVKFRNLNFDLGDALRSGRPVETDEDQLKALLEDDARQTVRELAEQLGCGIATVSHHLENSDKSKNVVFGYPMI